MSYDLNFGIDPQGVCGYFQQDRYGAVFVRLYQAVRTINYQLICFIANSQQDHSEYNLEIPQCQRQIKISNNSIYKMGGAHEINIRYQLPQSLYKISSNCDDDMDYGLDRD